MLTQNDVVIGGHPEKMEIVSVSKPSPYKEPKVKYIYQDEIDHRNTYIYEQAETCREEREEIAQFADIVEHNKSNAWLTPYLRRYYLEEYEDGQLHKEYGINRCEGLYAWAESVRSSRRGMVE